MNVKVGDQLKRVGGSNSYLKQGRIYTVRKIDILGYIWLVKCDNVWCQTKNLPSLGCECKGWRTVEGNFELVETSQVIALPTREEIKQAKDLPSPDDAASFFRRQI